MIRRSSLIIVLAISALTISCHKKYVHGLHKGMLGDVAKPGLHLFRGRSSGPMIEIDNLGFDNACLELGGLTATIDGAPMKLTYVGGRYEGRTPALGDIDKTTTPDGCKSATLEGPLNTDTARATNALEVTDGTRTIHATFANVAAPAVWKLTPPAIVHRAGITYNKFDPSAFPVRIEPMLPHGTGPYDSSNYVTADLDGKPRSMYADLSTQMRDDGTVAMTVRWNGPVGAFTLRVEHGQRGIPPISCDVPVCEATASSELTMPITVAP